MTLFSCPQEIDLKRVRSLFVLALSFLLSLLFIAYLFSLYCYTQCFPFGYFIWVFFFFFSLLSLEFFFWLDRVFFSVTKSDLGSLWNCFLMPESNRRNLAHISKTMNFESIVSISYIDGSAWFFHDLQIVLQEKEKEKEKLWWVQKKIIKNRVFICSNKSLLFENKICSYGRVLVLDSVDSSRVPP